MPIEKTIAVIDDLDQKFPRTAANDQIVLRLEHAGKLLLAARDAVDCKRIVDMARAAEIYKKRQDRADEDIAIATAIKIEAMAMMGEFLKTAPKNKGGNLETLKQKPTGGKKVPVETLADVGITKKESATAQIVAKVKAHAPEVFSDMKAGKVTIGQAVKSIKKKETPAAASPELFPTKANVSNSVGPKADPIWRTLGEIRGALEHLEKGVQAILDGKCIFTHSHATAVDILDFIATAAKWLRGAVKPNPKRGRTKDGIAITPEWVASQFTMPGD